MKQIWIVGVVGFGVGLGSIEASATTCSADELFGVTPDRCAPMVAQKTAPKLVAMSSNEQRPLAQFDEGPSARPKLPELTPQPKAKEKPTSVAKAAQSRKDRRRAAGAAERSAVINADPTKPFGTSGPGADASAVPLPVPRPAALGLVPSSDESRVADLDKARLQNPTAPDMTLDGKFNAARDPQTMSEFQFSGDSATSPIGPQLETEAVHSHKAEPGLRPEADIKLEMSGTAAGQPEPVRPAGTQATAALGGSVSPNDSESLLGSAPTSPASALTPGPKPGSDQQSEVSSLRPVVERSIWTDESEAAGALQKAATGIPLARDFATGDAVDEGTALEAIPGNLPPHPLAILGPRYFIANGNAVVVLPASRRVIEVYRRSPERGDVRPVR